MYVETLVRVLCFAGMVKRESRFRLSEFSVFSRKYKIIQTVQREKPGRVEGARGPGEATNKVNYCMFYIAC